MIGPPARAVERELVGRGVAHLDGDVERAVVHVGAELDERRRHVEAIVVDRDHRRRRAVAVLEIDVGATGSSRRTSASLPLRAANISAVKPPVGWSALLAIGERRDVSLPIEIGARFDAARSTTSI